MTIESAEFQPDEVVGAEDSTLTEGLLGTERPGSTPVDDAEEAAFFDSMGINVHKTQESEEEPAEEELPAEEEEEQEEETPPAGWQQRRVGLKRAHADLQAEHAEVRKFTDALLQTVLEMQGRGEHVSPEVAAAAGAPAQPQAQAPEPEPDIDIFEDPEGAVRQRVAREIEPLKAVISKLLEERQGFNVQNAQQTIAANLTAARIEYERENPGYSERAMAFQRGYVADLLELGFTPEQAQQQMGVEAGQIIQTAIRNGKNPIKALDTFARRYSSAQPAAAPRAPKPANERIAAARAATAGGVARPGPDPVAADIDPNQPVTVAALMAGGVKPEKVREMLRRPGGRGDFFNLMRQAEEAQARRR